MNNFQRVSLGLLALILAASPAPGQTTFASITGTITDASGAVVAGASVTAVHLESNYRYTAQSNATGAYTLGQLREGVYSLTIQAPGLNSS